MVFGKWLIVGRAIGNFQGQLILAIFYFILIWPLALIVRIFVDPLKISKKKILSQKSNFSKWEYEEAGLEEARRQY